MKMYDIIYKKREGKTLNQQEIEFFINGYVKGKIADYQASALLMACFLTGLNFEETTFLTMSMVNSGDVFDLSNIPGIKIDKHSTGGVGDTTTLIVAPLVAACGVKVAKMSGRGLGHTGGTIDKLHAIPGFNTDLSTGEFLSQVKDIGLSVVGQTMELVPADKMLYALRDVTATVDSIPLIASSVMSKKIALGADIIVLDVKIGSGAFMKELDQAQKLAKTMVEIGKRMNKKTVALITDMNQPLGQAVGNTMDVIEAIEVLKGKNEGDLKTVAFEIAAIILVQSDKANTLDDAKKLLQKKIDDGSAIGKLKDMIRAQQGDENILDDFSLFEKAKYQYEVKAKADGYIEKIDAYSIGRASCVIGSGREKKEDIIDLSVGIYVNKRIGEYVLKEDTLFEIYYNDKSKLNDAIDFLEKSYKLSKSATPSPTLIYEVISS